MESLERTKMTACGTTFIFKPAVCCLLLFVLSWRSTLAFPLLGQHRPSPLAMMIQGTVLPKPELVSMLSDIPGETGDTADETMLFHMPVRYLKSLIPPPPEDQFIMIGDVAVLSLYAFTSHYLNNFVVDSVISHSDSIQHALSTLDPTGEVTSLQQPVWVSVDQYDVVQNVLTLAAKENLLNHWGPLFSTAGSAYVALCTCWLLAGWWHRAFLFQNSLECDTGAALVKTIETWVSMALLMIVLAMACNELITVVPAGMVHQIVGSAMVDHVDYVMTKADSMFLIDSMTVLIAWRFMANSFMKRFF